MGGEYTVNNKMKLIIIAAFAVIGVGSLIQLSAYVFSDDAVAVNAVSSGEEDHDDGEEHDESEEHDDEEGALEMNASERQANGVETAQVGMRALAEEVTVPGEVTLDLYRTTQIAPRIAAQVVTRHIRLGETIMTGQPMATLSSVEMAEAQGNLIVANREWDRVRKLGRDVVSERRYVEAQVAAQQAQATVLAYGMSPEQVAAFLEDGDASKATGAFDLLAPQDGTIVKDDFVVGELAEPGRTLFEISDETRVWVEAQLSPEQAAHMTIGSPARVKVNGQHWLDGEVVQIHHRLDETTRTLPVRVEVGNTQDELHAGQFVNVAIQIGQGEPVLAVPEGAVVLMEGSSAVFKVEGDELHPQSVKTGANRGGWVEINAGLRAGEEIAVTQAFFLKSLILKSQMGEGHAH